MSGRQIAGKTRRRLYSREQTTSKVISISPELMAYIISRTRGKEAVEDTLRRLLNLPERETG